jgi:anti-sigma B factor antagonist
MLQQSHPPCPEEKVLLEGTVIHFAGRNVSLDEVNVEVLRGQLLALAEEPGPANVVLDFRNVGYVSSLALDTLVTLRNKLQAVGRRVALRNLSPQVYEVFAVTGLDRLLDARPASAGTELPRTGRPPSVPGGVLVVDDEMAVLCVLAAGLRRRGFNVWLAGDGCQAIEMYRQQREGIGVVLLDVRMPGMSGPQTLAALWGLWPGARCCFMTGDPGPYTEAALLRLGAARVFRKPFDLGEVAETLEELTGPASHQGQHRWIDLS